MNHGAGSFLVIGGNANDRLAHAQKLAPQAMVVSPTGIEEIREIRKLVALGQSVILQDAHNLTVEAQNALLKTLEEPPENTTIILCTSSEDLLLPTVVSRCQVIELPPVKIVFAPNEKKELLTILNWIGEGRVKEGFAWAEKLAKDRDLAIQTIDKLLTLKASRRLFATKKYLQANTNVRLTLENLFI